MIGNQKFFHSLITKSCFNDIYNRFIFLNIPYRNKAIFPSEMFLFSLLVCDFKSGDNIIESGTGYGGSTLYLAKLFPEVNIISIDDDKYNQFEKVKKEFENFRNVQLIKGNSIRILPSIVESLKGKRTAVLIDGPKRKLALNLVKKVLSNVEFVAVHDLSAKLSEQGVFNSRNAVDFRSMWDHLDSKVGEYHNVHYPNGPGLTIFVK